MPLFDYFEAWSDPRLFITILVFTNTLLPFIFAQELSQIISNNVKIRRKLFLKMRIELMRNSFIWTYKKIEEQDVASFC